MVMFVTSFLPVDLGADDAAANARREGLLLDLLLRLLHVLLHLHDLLLHLLLLEHLAAAVGKAAACAVTLCHRCCLLLFYCKIVEFTAHAQEILHLVSLFRARRSPTRKRTRISRPTARDVTSLKTSVTTFWSSMDFCTSVEQ